MNFTVPPGTGQAKVDLLHPAAARRDPDGHAAADVLGRSPEHGPGLERRRPAALLPDQSARRPALPAGRPPALPGRAETGADRDGAGHRPAARRTLDRARWPPHPVGSGDGAGPRLRPTPAAGTALDAVPSTAIAARRRHRRDLPLASTPSPRGAVRRRAGRRRYSGIARARPRRRTTTPRRDLAGPRRPPRRPGRRPSRPARAGRAARSAARIRRPGPRPRRGARRSARPPGAGAGRVAILADPADRVTLASLPGRARRSPSPSPARTDPWGVLLVVADGADALDQLDQDLHRRRRRRASATHRRPSAVGQEEVAHLLHRAEALRRVAGDIGSRLDLDEILDRPRRPRHGPVRGRSRRGLPAASPTASSTADVTRGPLDRAISAAVREFPARSLPARAVAARRPLFSVDYARRPARRRRPRRRRPGGLRHRSASRRCSMDGTEPLGLLNVYHDAAHPWTADELETIAAARDPGERRDPGRPELPADGDLDRPAPVDPAARRAAQPPHERHRTSASPSPPSCAS